MGYAFTAFLEREGKLLPVTFGARHCEEAEAVAPAIAASLGACLKEVRLMTRQPPVTVMQVTSLPQEMANEQRSALSQ
jgi:hypothetical protein